MRSAAQLRARSRSNSSESMRRLDDLRVDSFQQPPSWQEEGSYAERRGTLDDIDYMSDEEDGSPHDVSGSDTTRGASHAGRFATAAAFIVSCAGRQCGGLKMQGPMSGCPCRHVPYSLSGHICLPAGSYNRSLGFMCWGTARSQSDNWAQS